MKYSIDTEVLNSSRIRTNVKYKSLYNVLFSNSQTAKDNKEEISDLVSKSSKLFTTIFHSVSNELRNNNDCINTESSNLVYSSYLASSIILEDLKSSLEYESDTADARMSSSSLIRENLVATNLSEYASVKESLENMVEYVLNHQENPTEAAYDYFKEYANQASNSLQKILPKKVYNELKNSKWTVGPYTMNGLKPPKPIITVKSSNGHEDTYTKEDNRFDVPLKYFHIDKDKLLSKDRIIGDSGTITFIERMVKCLFLYNPKFDANPAKIKKLYRNKVLLQGTEGTGKGAVSTYAIDYAERFNNNVQKNLMVTKFGISSHWKSGMKQKLEYQLNQISNDKRVYFIFEEEIDDILMNESAGKQEKSDLQIINEFNKFLDGGYPDKGNYLFLANVNDFNNLRKTTKSRFKLINWKGANNPSEKGTLFKFKLEDGINAGFVNLKAKDFQELGQLSYTLGLNGRDITNICNQSLSDSFLWNDIAEINELDDNLNAQCKKIDEMHNKIYFEHLEAATTEFAEQKDKAEQDSKIFNMVN